MKEKRYVKTYLYYGPIDVLADAWQVFWQGDLKRAQAMDEDAKRTFISSLGRELAHQETRGKRCVRLRFNDKGVMLYGDVYSPQGRKIGNIHFGLPDDDWDKEVIPPKINQPRPDFIESSREEEITDPDEFKEKYINGDYFTVTEKNNTQVHYVKIKPSPLDLYILDPESTSIYCGFDVNSKIPYQFGYKLTEIREMTSDGIIHAVQYNEYNAGGLLIKQRLYSGTPWGGIILDEIVTWTYDLSKRLVTAEMFNVSKNKLDRANRYELTDDFKLKRNCDYVGPEVVLERRSDFKSAPCIDQLKMMITLLLDAADLEDAPEWLVKLRDITYSYNNQELIREKITRFRDDEFTPFPNCVERCLYEYDSNRRVIHEQEYNAEDTLETEIFFRYEDNHHVHQTWRFYKNSLSYFCLMEYGV